MDDLYNIRLSVEGLSETMRQLTEVNKKLAGLGGDAAGIKSWQVAMRNAVQQMEHSARSVANESTRISKATRQMMANLQQQGKAVEKTLEGVNRSSKQFLQNKFKNNSFSGYLADLKKLEQGAALSETRLRSLMKQTVDFDSVMKDIRRNPSHALAFKQMYGSDAEKYLQNKAVFRAYNTLSESMAKAETERMRKSADLSARDTAQEYAKNNAYERQITNLQRMLTLKQGSAQALENELRKLKHIEAEYQRIQALARTQQSAAMRTFVTKTASPSAATADASIIRRNLIAQALPEVDTRWKGIHKSVTDTLYRSGDLHQVWRGLAASTGQIWMSWGRFLPMAAGLGIGSSIFKSLSVGKDFGWQMEMVGVAAETGSEKVQLLKQAILDINSSGSLQGPKQMASALRVLAQAGLDTKEALEALPTTLNLALVAEVSDDQSAQFLAGLRSAFNLTSAEALREGADQTAKAAAVSQTSIQKIMEALKQASPEAARFKLSVADTSAALAMLAKFNIEGSAAGTSMRRFLSDLAGRTPQSRKALEQLGLSAYNAQGMLKPFTQMVAEFQDKLSGLKEKDQQLWLKRIFDERGLKAASILLSDAGRDFAKMHAELQRAGENMGYTTTQAARLGQTAEGSFRKMKNSWEGMFATIGSNSEGGFKELMSSLTGLANDRSIRAIGSGLAEGFLAAARAGVFLAKAVAPLVPALGGMATGLAAFGIFKSGAMAATIAAVGKAFATLRAGMVAFSVVAATNAATIGGLTGALHTARYAAISLWTALGPAGWLAVSIGGIAAYMLMAEKRAISFRDEVGRLDKALGSVNTTLYEEFNKSGEGLGIDKQLGIGFKADKTQSLVHTYDVSGVVENEKRIHAAVTKSLSDVRTQYSNNAAFRLEQETMVKDRHLSLIKEQLENFDKFTADKEDMDRNHTEVRKGLVQSIYSLETELSAKRIELAKQQMRDLAAEAVKQQSLLSKMLEGRGEGGERLNLIKARISKEGAASLSAEDLSFKQKVDAGVPVNVAHAQTTSTIDNNIAKELRDVFFTKAGQDERLAQAQANPRETAIYMAELRSAWERDLKTAEFQARNAKDLDKRPRFAAEANALKKVLAGLSVENFHLSLVGAKKLQDQYGTRTSPNLKAGEDLLGSSGNTPKSAPSYIGIGANNIKLKEAEAYLSNLEAQKAREEAAYGSATDSTFDLVKAQRLLVASIKDGKLSLEREKQIKAATKAINDPKMPEEDRARARADLAALSATRQATLPSLSTDFGFKFALKNDHVKYRMGSRNTATGYIDCSGFVAQLQESTFTELNRQLGRTEFNSAELTGLVAADQIKKYADKGGMVTQGRKDSLNADLLQPGMLIGTDNGAKSWDRGRYKGIDHIVIVVKGENGKKYVSQSSSGKGVHTIPLDQYLKGNSQAYVVDPLAGKRSLLGESAGSDGSSEIAKAVLKNEEESRKRMVDMATAEYNAAVRSLDTRKQKLAVAEILGMMTASERKEAELAADIEKIRLDTQRKITELKAQGKDFEAKQVDLDATAQIDNMTKSFNASIAAQRDWRVGLRNSYNKLVDESMNYGSFAASAFDSVTGTMIGAMQQLAVTGKLNFREMTVSILSDLAKIAMRMAMLKLINAAVSAWGGGQSVGEGMMATNASTGFVASAKGNAFDSSGHLTAYAGGGVVNSPTRFRHGGGRGLMGENGAEGILPLSRMSNGDLGVRAMGSGGGAIVEAPVNVSVTVHADGSSESDVDAQGFGKTLGNVIRGVVQEEMAKALRPGGMLAARS